MATVAPALRPKSLSSLNSPFSHHSPFSRSSLGCSPARLLHRPLHVQSIPRSPTVHYAVTSSGRFFKLASSRSRPYSQATSRLSLISRHLEEHQQSPYLPINTPYTTERASLPSDDLPWTPPSPPAPPPRSPTQLQKRQFSTSPSAKMSSQPSHPSLLIPGPIEISDEVSQAMGHYAQSHVGQPFVNTFGETLTQLRELFQTSNPKSQPFVLAGSGTL